MHPNRSRAHACRFADFTRGPLVEMRESEHQPLPVRQGRHGLEDLLPPFPGEQFRFGGGGGSRRLFHRSLVLRVVQRASNPPLLPAPALQPVEAGIDEYPHEPPVEGQILAILLDVQKHLYEGVLHGLVGIGGIAEVVIRDAQSPALQERHEGAEPIASGLALASQHERLDFGGNY